LNYEGVRPSFLFFAKLYGDDSYDLEHDWIPHLEEIKLRKIKYL
jgi:hypothetical protein